MTVHHDRPQRRHTNDKVLPAGAESRYPPAATDPNHANPKADRTRRQRRTPIRVATPAVAAMSEEDRHQAVTALATMIAAWWHDQQQHSPNLHELQPGNSHPDRTRPEPDPPEPPPDCED
jgi:hypothetical protein